MFSYVSTRMYVSMYICMGRPNPLCSISDNGQRIGELNKKLKKSKEMLSFLFQLLFLLLKTEFAG